MVLLYLFSLYLTNEILLHSLQRFLSSKSPKFILSAHLLVIFNGQLLVVKLGKLTTPRIEIKEDFISRTNSIEEIRLHSMCVGWDFFIYMFELGVILRMKDDLVAILVRRKGQDERGNWRFTPLTELVPDLLYRNTVVWKSKLEDLLWPIPFGTIELALWWLGNFIVCYYVIMGDCWG